MTGQLFQISRQLTTLELSNIGKYGYMSGSADGRLAEQPAAATVTMSRTRKLSSALLRLVGLDLYTHGGGARALQQQTTSSSAGKNPFDRGIITNCSDFWTEGRTLGVDYRQLYELGDVETTKC